MSPDLKIIDISDDEEVPAWEQLPARCADIGSPNAPK